MSKRAKTIITTILLIMALFQGPYFYYYTDGFIKLIFSVPFYLTGLILSIILALNLIIHRSTNTQYTVIGLTIAFLIGLLTVRVNAMEYIDFHLQKSKRDKIVEDIKRGVIISEHLNDYSFLPISNGGNDITIAKNNNGTIEIEFFVDRGFIDHYSVFLYTNNVVEINNFDKGIATRDMPGVSKMANNWYRISY
jgi:hypothetical protein